MVSCCGKEMQVRYETPRYYEMSCQTCKDTIHVKKDVDVRPIMLDD